MSGTLFVVATPIGNMEDVTLRALRVLREVDVIAAEDTRRTARLLSHYAIATPTISFHQHNVRTRLPQLLSRLHAGNNVAVVTDAGTPGVSDPGVELVDACVKAHVAVDAIPGPNAPLTAAVASGCPLIPLTILGFAPRRSKDRLAWFSEIKAILHTVTFFESPHRIAATLSDAHDILGDRPIVLGRELTKQHQEYLRGTSGTVLAQIGQPRGEITIVIGPHIGANLSLALSEKPPSMAGAVTRFGQLTDLGYSRRQAMTEAARAFNLPVRKVYAAVEEAKKLGE